MDADERASRRAEPAAQEDAEFEELSEMIHAGAEIVLRSESLAMAIFTGTARLDEVRDFLATADRDNLYGDISRLQIACVLAGLDPETGALGIAASGFLAMLRLGLSEDEARANSTAIPRAFALWVQDAGFVREVKQIRATH